MQPRESTSEDELRDRVEALEQRLDETEKWMIQVVEFVSKLSTGHDH